MARFQKKRLEDIIAEGGWNLNLGGIPIGSLLGGLTLRTDSKGNRKLGGNVSTKLPGTNVSIGAGTDDLGQFTGKKKTSQDNKTKTSKTNTGYNTSLKPGDKGYKSELRRRQEAARRNQ